MFTSSIGTPIDLRNVTRAFKAVLKTAEMPMIRLHDLRHSCATLLLAQGVSLGWLWRRWDTPRCR